MVGEGRLGIGAPELLSPCGWSYCPLVVGALAAHLKLFLIWFSIPFVSCTPSFSVSVVFLFNSTPSVSPVEN